MDLCTGSVSAERVGQGEVGWVTHRVLCIWWLLGLDVKVTVGTGWATSCPDCMERLKNIIFTL